MAFAMSHRTSGRTGTAIAVVLLEGVAIYAIVTGLTMKGERIVDTIFRTHNVPAPPKPTVEPDRGHKVQRDKSTITAPPERGDIKWDRSGLEVKETSGGEGTGPVVIESPTSIIEPVRQFVRITPPQPRGHPGDWVRPDDYPSQDRREGNQGTVRFRLSVNAEGRATACEVTGSSGFPRLDAAACARLVQRARFDPAVGENGVRVAGAYASAVRWVIPE